MRNKVTLLKEVNSFQKEEQFQAFLNNVFENTAIEPREIDELLYALQTQYNSVFSQVPQSPNFYQTLLRAYGNKSSQEYTNIIRASKQQNFNPDPALEVFKSNLSNSLFFTTSFISPFTNVGYRFDQVAPYPITLLEKAIENGDVAMVALLLKSGVSVQHDISDEDKCPGGALLRKATLHESPNDIFKLLAEHGAIPNVSETQKMAQNRGYQDGLKLLEPPQEAKSLPQPIPVPQKEVQKVQTKLSTEHKKGPSHKKPDAQPKKTITTPQEQPKDNASKLLRDFDNGFYKQALKRIENMSKKELMSPKLNHKKDIMLRGIEANNPNIVGALLDKGIEVTITHRISSTNTAISQMLESENSKRMGLTDTSTRSTSKKRPATSNRIETTSQQPTTAKPVASKKPTTDSQGKEVKHKKPATRATQLAPNNTRDLMSFNVGMRKKNPTSTLNDLKKLTNPNKIDSAHLKTIFQDPAYSKCAQHMLSHGLNIHKVKDKFGMDNSQELLNIAVGGNNKNAVYLLGLHGAKSSKNLEENAALKSTFQDGASKRETTPPKDRGKVGADYLATHKPLKHADKENKAGRSKTSNPGTHVQRLQGKSSGQKQL